MDRASKLSIEVMDLNRIRENPSPDFVVFVDDSSIFYWRVDLNGPAGSDFNGYRIALRLKFQYNLNLPPTVYANRNIYPPNVRPISKRFWLRELNHDGWSPVKKVHKALMSGLKLVADSVDGVIVDMDGALMYYDKRSYRAIIKAKNRARTD